MASIHAAIPPSLAPIFPAVARIFLLIFSAVADIPSSELLTSFLTVPSVATGLGRRRTRCRYGQGWAALSSVCVCSSLRLCRWASFRV